MGIENIKVHPIYENRLDMRCFSNMLESPTQSYKFYWFESVLSILPQKDIMTFEEIVFEMFWEAWFTVTQYHLHLGPTIEGKSENYIEHALHIIEKDPDIKLPMNKEQFNGLLEKNRNQIKVDIDGIIKNVPYRLLSSFMSEIGGNDKIWDQKKRLIAYLKSVNRNVYLPYIILDGRGAQKMIKINPAWKLVLLDNYSVIKSWVQMKKVRFLQDRNPNVPGVIYKLECEDNRVRKLERVRELWFTYEAISGTIIHDPYNGKEVSKENFSIDHFVPWSYVTNDELWNLVPVDSANNSRKGNRLPEWNRCFPLFSLIQYDLYKAIFENDHLRRIFEMCKSQNLNAIWATEYLYVPGNTKERFGNILEHNMKPIYEAAMLQGYTVWRQAQ